MMEPQVILVDETDNPLGVMDKYRAHKEGLLHRAFSVLIFNRQGEWLLQQRADDKYHSAGLWSNTCCSHPAPGEETAIAANRRLREEMGIDCEIEKISEITYRINFENGLTEHEYDHVFFGTSDVVPNPNLKEVKTWKYLSSEDLKSEIRNHPDKFTFWFRLLFEKVYSDIQQFTSWKKSF